MADKDGKTDLFTIPEEMLTHIASFLPAKDVGALRLTCKHIRKYLLYAFKTRFFREMQFSLTNRSLHGFDDISRHPDFSQSLRHIAITTEHFAVDLPWSGMPHEIRDRALEISQTAADLDMVLEWEVASQKHILENGYGTKILSESFGRLSHLETVSIRDYASGHLEGTHDYATFPGWQDAPAMCSFRTTSTQSTTGGRLRPPTFPAAGDSGIIRIDKVFGITLAALAMSHAHPSGLEVITKARSNWGIEDRSFHMLPALRPSFETLLAGPTKLHLALSLPPPLRHQRRNDSRLPSALHIQPFLRQVPSLTWLRLGFQGASVANPNAIDMFFRWLAGRADPNNPRCPEAMHEAPVFKKLERLDIGRAALKLDTLRQLYRRFHPTLKKSTLMRVALLHSKTTGNKYKVRTWPRLFRYVYHNTNMTGIRLVGFNTEDGFDTEVGPSESSASRGVKIQDMVEKIHDRWESINKRHDIPYSRAENEGTDDEGQEDDTSRWEDEAVIPLYGATVTGTNLPHFTIMQAHGLYSESRALDIVEFF